MRRRLGWQPVNDHRSVCAKRWLLVREDVAKKAKCAANLIAICTVVLRQTWQYGVNRRCVPPFFFCSLPPNTSTCTIRINQTCNCHFIRFDLLLLLFNFFLCSSPLFCFITWENGTTTIKQTNLSPSCTFWSFPSANFNTHLFLSTIITTFMQDNLSCKKYLLDCKHLGLWSPTL